MSGQGRLEGRVAVITGAASGIGEGTVRRFIQEGAKVIIADVQDAPGAALAKELGSATRFVHTDVTLEDDVARAIDLAVSEFGQLDIMFNNAGIVGAVGRIADTNSDQWDRTVAILMRGIFLGMKHASRVMVPRQSGVILSTSSTAGIQGGLGPHCYTACKHAVIGLTKSVASELAQHHVRVNAISPGSWLIKEISVTSALAYMHEEFEMAMGMIADGRFRTEPMHSSTIGIEGLDAALSDLASGTSTQTKILVDPRL